MPVIFQTEPPVVNVHHLPKGASFFSYKIDDLLNIKAWMPDGYKEIHQEFKMSNDDFYNEYCEQCSRNCYSFLNDHCDEDGEVDWSDIPGGEGNHCYVYDDGYTGQHCPEGNVIEDDSIDMKIANMVFKVGLNYKSKYNIFSVESDSACLRAGKVEFDRVYSTDFYQASNVFGDSTQIGHICWGGNTAPDNLKGIVDVYFNSPFNNDLLPVTIFDINCENLRRDVQNDNFKLLHNEKFLCYGGEADAVLLVHAEYNIPAFFTLLSAGFQPLEELKYVMIIPLQEVRIEKDGAFYDGYQTSPDSLNKRWFISSSYDLVGQI